MKGKGKLKARAFDSAEYLDTPEAIAAYLADALNTGSPAEFQDALNVVARARGMTEIAKAAGVGRENLYNALRHAPITAHTSLSHYARSVLLLLAAQYRGPNNGDLSITKPALGQRREMFVPVVVSVIMFPPSTTLASDCGCG